MTETEMAELLGAWDTLNVQYAEIEKRRAVLRAEIGAQFDRETAAHVPCGAKKERRYGGIGALGKQYVLRVKVRTTERLTTDGRAFLKTYHPDYMIESTTSYVEIRDAGVPLRTMTVPEG